VTRQAFIDQLQTLGSVITKELPGGQLLAILEKQRVPDSVNWTRVAFVLDQEVGGRPRLFVDETLTTVSGGYPNNRTTELLAGEVFATWSFNTPWNPTEYTADQLVYAALAQWSR
jgi:hypothetical protein